MMEMERPEHVETGEKLFVIGLVVSFVIEVAFAAACVLERTWGGFFFGVLGAVVILRLSNGLYAGSASAVKWLLGWTGLQLLLALAAFILSAAAPGRDNPAALLGYGISWVPYGKLAAYVIVGAVFFSASVRAFLFLKAGGALADVKTKSPLAASGASLPLTAEQSQTVATLAGLLRWASIVLIVVGIVRAYFGWTAANAPITGASNELTAIWARALPPLVDGIAMLLVGIVLLGPAGAFDFLKTKSTDTTFLMNALGQLRCLYLTQAALAGLMIVGVVIALVLRLLPG